MHSKFATGKQHLLHSHTTIVPDKPVFPDEEVKVLKFWEEINAFHKQLELSKGKKEYTFYDGPPFATGLPHYGHIAAGTIKVNSPLSFLEINLLRFRRVLLHRALLFC
jgi:isoleucyl-tRNA synthetase